MSNILFAFGFDATVEINMFRFIVVEYAPSWIVLYSLDMINFRCLMLILIKCLKQLKIYRILFSVVKISPFIAIIVLNKSSGIIEKVNFFYCYSSDTVRRTVIIEQMAWM